MALAKRIEDLEDSAVLGRNTSTRLMELYVEEAIPLAENIDVLIEHDKRALTTRVAFHGTDGTYKYMAVQHDFDDTIGMYKDTVDRMLYKIQEELDKEPEDAQVHTEPTQQYAPKAWAAKVAKKARGLNT